MSRRRPTACLGKPSSRGRPRPRWKTAPLSGKGAADPARDVQRRRPQRPARHLAALDRLAPALAQLVAPPLEPLVELGVVDAAVAKTTSRSCARANARTKSATFCHSPGTGRRRASRRCRGRRWRRRHRRRRQQGRRTGRQRVERHGEASAAAGGARRRWRPRTPIGRGAAAAATPLQRDLQPTRLASFFRCAVAADLEVGTTLRKSPGAQDLAHNCRVLLSLMDKHPALCHLPENETICSAAAAAPPQFAQTALITAAPRARGRAPQNSPRFLHLEDLPNALSRPAFPLVAVVVSHPTPRPPAPQVVDLARNYLRALRAECSTARARPRAGLRRAPDQARVAFAAATLAPTSAVSTARGARATPARAPACTRLPSAAHAHRRAPPPATQKMRGAVVLGLVARVADVRDEMPYGKTSSQRTRRVARRRRTGSVRRRSAGCRSQPRSSRRRTPRPAERSRGLNVIIVRARLSAE